MNGGIENIFGMIKSDDIADQILAAGLIQFLSNMEMIQLNKIMNEDYYAHDFRRVNKYSPNTETWVSLYDSNIKFELQLR